MQRARTSTPPGPGGRPWGPPGWPPVAGGGNGTNPDPDEPVFTTLAIGEEGDPDPASGTIARPHNPTGNGGTFTTLALGEEGDPASVPTTLALGEEGDSGPAPSPAAPGHAGNPWEGRVTTLALGEEGDAGLGSSEA